MRQVLEAAEAPAGDGIEAEALTCAACGPWTRKLPPGAPHQPLPGDSDWLMAGYGLLAGWCR
jgi:hypothetical protein